MNCFLNPPPCTRSQILLLILSFFTMLWGQPESVRGTFIILVPPGTDQVILVGNLESLGNWDPSQAPRLHTTGGDTFQTTITLPINQSIEYKFTRGPWATEALDERGLIPGNHQLTLMGDSTIRHTIPKWRNEGLSPGTQVTGEVRVHAGVYSPQLKNERDIVVWLPPSYGINTDTSYPVLYMHDGQNIFDPYTSFLSQEWRMDEIVTELIQDDEIQEIIIVGVYNTENRTLEYSPVHRGNAYSEFLIQTVKPLIDKTYRTRPEPEYTAVMGSSMGGIISFHLAWEYPDVFSMAGCLSPAFLVDDHEIIERVYRAANNTKITKLVIMNGGEGLEEELQPAVDAMVTALMQNGYREGKDLIVRFVPGAEHNENAWAKQVEIPLRFFFGR